MKYIKLFMLMVAVTIFGACSSDDDSWNSVADVTVGMQSPTMTVSEGKGVFNVPIVVNGKTNGNVFVTVAVEEVGDNPAKENVNYYVTDKTINISDSAGHVEIETVEDEDINESRTFKVTIVDAKGAKIAENASTIITLKDNDAEFYSKLQGKWTMTGVDRDGEAVSWDVTVTGASDETEEDFNKVLYVSGINGESSCEAQLSYSFDTTTKTGSVAFDALGEYAMAAFNFSIGPHYVIPYNLKNNAWTTDPIEGSWSDDLKTITFGEGMLTGRLFTYPDVQPTNYLFFSIANIKMTKK